MKKIYLIIAIIGLLCSVPNAYAQNRAADYLNIQTDEGTVTANEGSSSAFVSVASVTIDLGSTNSHVEKIMITTAFDFHNSDDGNVNTNREVYAKLRMNTGTVDGPTYQRQIKQNGAGVGVLGYGQGTLVYVFDVSALSGSQTFSLQGANPLSVVWHGHITATPLSTALNEYDLNYSHKSINATNPTTTSTTYVAIPGLTTTTVHKPGLGNYLVIASINSGAQLGASNLLAEYRLEYSVDGTNWEAFGRSVTRTLINNYDDGIITLTGLMQASVNDMMVRAVVKKNGGGGTIITRNGDVLLLSLSHSNGGFFSTIHTDVDETGENISGGVGTDGIVVESSSFVAKSAVGGVTPDLFIISQHQVGADKCMRAGNHIFIKTGTTTTPEDDFYRFILNSSNKGSCGFNSKMDLTAGSSYTVGLTQKIAAIHQGQTTAILTTSSVIISGFQSIDEYPATANEPSGAGTTVSPYQISSLGNLLWMSEHPEEMDKVFHQTANINASSTSTMNAGEGFIPLSTFDGTYDGQGHIISGLTILRFSDGDPSVGSFSGLFGYVGSGTITNVGLTGVSIKGSYNVGGLAGELNSSATVTHCYATGSVTGHHNTSYGLSSTRIGGLIGNCHGTVTESYSEADVFGTHDMGGFIGQGGGATDCYSTGDVTSSDDGGTYGTVGGFIGYKRGSVTRCYSLGSVYYTGGAADPTNKGFAGDGSGSVDCYFDKTVSNQTTAITATAYTTTQMKDLTNFSNWMYPGTQTAGTLSAWDRYSAINDAYPFIAFFHDLEWTGTNSVTWGVIENYKNTRILPEGTRHVLIPDVTNDPIVTYQTESTTYDLTIESGATFTLSPEAKINILGDLNNSGALFLESDDERTASLIIEGDADNKYVHVERYIDNVAWHIFSPTTDNTSSGTFYDVDNDFWLLKYTNAINDWEYVLDTAISLTVGVGYAVVPTYTTTYTTKGNMQLLDLTRSLAYGGTGENTGLNTIGNPFTSAVLFNNTWGFTNTEATLYMLNAAGSAYVTKSAATTYDLPVSQGAFIAASGAGASVTIPRSAQIHSNNFFWKSDKYGNYENIVNIRAASNGKFDEVYVSFQDNGTEGFENGWDASKLFTGEEFPQLYMNVQDRTQCYNHLPLLQENEDRVIPLSYVPQSDGAQSFTADLGNFHQTEVILEDLKTGEMHDFIAHQVYEFSALTTDMPERFLLHFKASANGLEETTNKQIAVYAYDNHIYINTTDVNTNGTATIVIYDLLGKELYSQQLRGNDLEVITLNTNQTYVIAKVIKGKTIVIQKLLMN